MSVEGPPHTMTDWHGEARASFDPAHSSVLGQSPSVGGTKVNGDCISAACWFVHGPVTPESRLGPARSVACLCLEKGLTNDVYAVILDICWQNLSPVRHLEWN